MYCGKCGQQIEGKYRFCNNCGAPVQNKPVLTGGNMSVLTTNNTNSTKITVLILTALTLLSPIYPLVYVLTNKTYDTMINVIYGIFLAEYSTVFSNISDKQVEHYVTYLKYFSFAYLGFVILGFVYIISAFKRLLSDQIYVYKFWSDCFISNIVMGISSILVYLDVFMFNSIATVRLKSPIGSISVLVYILLITNLILALYSNAQKKRSENWFRQQRIHSDANMSKIQ